MTCLVLEMVLTLTVPVAFANAPVPPVTLPLVTTPVLGWKVNVQYRNPPLVSTVKFTATVLGEAALKYSMSKPTVLPAALTSVPWRPPEFLVKLVAPFCKETSLSVCVVPCALATAGSTSAPVVPKTTAAPAAARDVRSLMVSAPCHLNLAVQASLTDDPPADRVSPRLSPPLGVPRFALDL